MTQCKGSPSAQHGFTLVELVIAMAIGGLLLGVVTSMLLQLNSLTHVHEESLRLSHQLQQAASVLNRDVVSAVGGQVTASAQGVTLTLDILGVEFGKATDPVTRTVTYAYSPAAQTLSRRDQGGLQVISRQVSAFDLGPSRTITSTLWVTMTVTGREQEQLMTLQLYRRPGTGQ